MSTREEAIERIVDEIAGALSRGTTPYHIVEGAIKEAIEAALADDTLIAALCAEALDEAREACAKFVEDWAAFDRAEAKYVAAVIRACKERG